MLQQLGLPVPASIPTAPCLMDYRLKATQRRFTFSPEQEDIF